MKKVKILIIDDEMSIGGTFEGVKFLLNEDHNIDIEYKVANTLMEMKQILDKDFIYDIIFIDYKLKGDFLEEMNDGSDIIKVSRERNQLCKIVFFSSVFSKLGTTELSSRDYFELINEFKIDKIISKDNEEIVKAIVDLSQGINLLSLTLKKMIKNYEKIGEQFYYLTDSGVKIFGKDVIKELEKNSEIGKEFEEKYYITLNNMVLDCDFGEE